MYEYNMFVCVCTLCYNRNKFYSKLNYNFVMHTLYYKYKLGTLRFMKRKTKLTDDENQQ